MQDRLSFSNSSEGSWLRSEITHRHRISEDFVVNENVVVAAFDTDMERQTRLGASALIEKIRNNIQLKLSVNELMSEFSLSTDEGVALMCMAEALIRIPDLKTRSDLIDEKIIKGNWHLNLNKGGLFVNATAWGLFVSKKIITPSSDDKMSGALSRAIYKGGSKVVRRAVYLIMQVMGSQFVMGESIDSALQRSKKEVKAGYLHSFDMLGESAVSQEDVDRYMSLYKDAIEKIGKFTRNNNCCGLVDGQNISIKLSALHARYSEFKQERVYEELFERMKSLCLLAKEQNMSINIDAEESDRLELSIDLFEALLLDEDLQDWNGLGFVVQAYQKRALSVIHFIVALVRNCGKKTLIRLVKGAYWDSEIKKAQEESTSGYSVFSRKAHSDIAFIACARELLKAKDCVYPQFATHNAHSIAAVYEMARRMEHIDFEFQCLHGMGGEIYSHLIKNPNLLNEQNTKNKSESHKIRCRIYAPVGNYSTLLPYLVRRILENGSNSSFVNKVVDKKINMGFLVESPFSQLKNYYGSQHQDLPMPENIFGDRKNSSGFDFTNRKHVETLKNELYCLSEKCWEVIPEYSDEELFSTLEKVEVYNPSNIKDLVGEVYFANSFLIDNAFKRVNNLKGIWSGTPISKRCEILNKFADLLEDHKQELISLCTREAGKTLVNCDGEIREAVDFCRYYSISAGAYEKCSPRGVVLCISPWNFPIAIFVGQVVAALSVGNVVVAKPAEETSLTAAFVTKLLYEAGLPSDALQCIYGRGEDVGQMLVNNSIVDAVMFTGSTEVAKLIQKSLVSRTDKDVAFIAETGGQNAMVVDSSALLDVAVLDTISSAFDSAGQRCSALRLLCVQEDVYDKFISMLKGAMDELELGDPSLISTDIGPIISSQAKEKIVRYIDKKSAEGRVIHRIKSKKFLKCLCGCTQDLLTQAELRSSEVNQSDTNHEVRTPLKNNSLFVAPTLIKVDSVSDLRREIFGPVLHVLRYKKDNLTSILSQINATGFGLTFGVHTRLNKTMYEVLSKSRSGNIYINRNIIGAIVGVQPFGGNGLSGTGPKAGGPIYLSKLVCGCNSNLTYTHLLVDDEATNDGATSVMKSCINTDAYSWLRDKARSETHSLTKEILRSFDINREHLENVYHLRSYVGEKNLWHLMPKGWIYCVAKDIDSLSLAVVISLLVGNKVVLDATECLHRKVFRSLPEELRSRTVLSNSPEHEWIDGVLCDDIPSRDWLRNIASHSRAVLSISYLSSDFDWSSILTERSISNNISAIGGNAELINTIY